MKPFLLPTRGEAIGPDPNEKYTFGEGPGGQGARGPGARGPGARGQGTAVSCNNHISYTAFLLCHMLYIDYGLHSRKHDKHPIRSPEAFPITSKFNLLCLSIPITRITVIITTHFNGSYD